MNILDTVGNTPLVKLEKINPYSEIDIYVKLEFMNPSGSIKDRIVKHIIDDAEKQGALKPGGTIVENTSGNTGAAAAMIGARRGYRVILTMPDKVSIEKQDALKAYGAEVIVCPTAALPDDPDHYVNKAKSIAEGIEGSFMLNQYNNPKNPEAHYLSTGPEIWEQTNGKITHFVASGSTGGTITGNSRYLKEKNPNLIAVMPDPIGSVFYGFFKNGKVNPEDIGTYQVEGVGEDHIVGAIDFDVIDDVYPFTDAQAFAVARELARKEGIMGGGTGGANVWGALQLASTLTKPATIVTIIPDNGVKYLSKFYNDEWMKKEGHQL